MNTAELLPSGPAAVHPHGLESDLLPTGRPTLESLEAGLMALAHGIGRYHAQRVRRAMNGVITATSASPVLLPSTASQLGSDLDSTSLEQADA